MNSGTYAKIEIMKREYQQRQTRLGNNTHIQENTTHNMNIIEHMHKQTKRRQCDNNHIYIQLNKLMQTIITLEHCFESKIFASRANHSRAANIDIFDDFFARISFGNSFNKRI